MQIKYIDLIALSQTLRRELLLKADMTKQEFLEKLDIERNLEIRIKAVGKRNEKSLIEGNRVNNRIKT